MNLSKITGLTLSAAILLSIGATAPVFANDNKDNSMSVEVRAFNPSLKFEAKSNSIKYDNNSAIDFKNELGIDSKSAPEIRINLNKNVRLDYLKINQSGSASLKDSLTYEGNHYDVGANVDSKLDMTYVRATWLRPLTKSPKVTTNWMIDIKGFQFDTAIAGTSSAGTYASSSKKFSGAIPTLGFAAETTLDNAGKIKATAEISGLPLGRYGHIVDYEAGIKYLPVNNLSINAGYRCIDINVKNDDEHAQYKLSGPYVGLEYKF